MDQDKLFDLMTRMYSEMQQGFKEFRESQTAMQQDINGIKQDIKVINAKIDGDISDHLKALYDGYKQNYEMICEIKEQVNENTEDIKEMNINMLGMKEDINLLITKSMRNDTKIDRINEKLKIIK